MMTVNNTAKNLPARIVVRFVGVVKRRASVPSSDYCKMDIIEYAPVKNEKKINCPDMTCHIKVRTELPMSPFTAGGTAISAAFSGEWNMAR